MLPKIKSEQQIVEEGRHAAILLNDPVFNDTMSSLTALAEMQFFYSDPSDKSGREDAYNYHRGLLAIRQELEGRVQAKDAILDTQTQDANETDDSESD